MAKKKAGSTTKTNKDSNSKRLGVKKFGSEAVKPGNIIVRQRGNRFYPGEGTKQGNDFTIYAVTSGKVQFKRAVGKSVVEVNG